jgi:hypothetical protein
MLSKNQEWLHPILREHPALLVSSLYVAASAIGMFYSWAFLSRFGINVFNYAQLGDFLLASLKAPATWAIVFLTVALVLLDNASSRRLEKRGPGKWLGWYRSPRYRFVNIFLAIAMVLFLIFLYARSQARITKSGEVKLVDVAFAEGGAAKTAALIGTTGQYVFLYDANTKRVDIHPIEGIHSISFQAE